MEHLSYPIGRYEEQAYSDKQRDEWIRDIEFLPGDLEYAITNLDAEQLNTPYRDGGWTVRQLVHHVADSHMNACIRFKLGLTEDNPSIKAYDQDAWANLQDSALIPVNVSVTLLHALHLRWVALLQSISGEQWQRTLYHPEYKKQMTLWYLLGLYAWHGRHHVAHIRALRNRMDWN
ncbi:MAG: bacillithiol transferase BstA [Ferruginibacter sp.]|jgi:uncharacterized damage-inducible protein DinB